MPEPRVTFIIPCFNHGRYIGAAVESCLRQERADVRVVIVNDGSDDGSTREACDALASERVHVRHQSNAGLSAARNTALDIARTLGKDWHGEYVAFLDADDFIESTFVKELDGALQNQPPEVSHAYCQERLVELGHGVWKVPEWDAELLLITNLHPVTCLIRWEALDAIGGFDATMRDGYEDWNLWITLSERGYRGVRVPSVLFNWRRHSNDTMIFDAVRKHDMLYASIIEKHPALYEPRFESLLKRTNSMIRSWNMNWLDESGEPIPLINLKRARDELVRMREQHHVQAAELASVRAALTRAEEAIRRAHNTPQDNPPSGSWTVDTRIARQTEARVRAEYERMAAIRFHHAAHRLIRILPSPLARLVKSIGGRTLRLLAHAGGVRTSTVSDATGTRTGDDTTHTHANTSQSRVARATRQSPAHVEIRPPTDTSQSGAASPLGPTESTSKGPPPHADRTRGGGTR